MKSIQKMLQVSLLGCALLVPQTASAFNSDYYLAYANKISNTASKRYFVNTLTKSLERRVAVYDNIINRYAKYSNHAWYKRFVAQRELFKTQLDQWVQLRDSLGSSPTIVDTVVATSDYQKVTKKPEELTSSNTRQFEERDGNIVSVYNEITRLFTTPVTTKTFLITRTTNHYSDGTQHTTTKAKLKSTVNSKETRTEVDKVFVRQYAIVEDNTSKEGMGTPTEGALTEEQYLAREDVVYDGTDGYYNAAVKLWSGFNRSTVDRHWAPYTKNLEQIGAPAAWSRGWTGKGATIAILDTGIDLDHSEFEGRIVDTACLSFGCTYYGETIDDINNVSHGTHVAGIAAAALDGVGMTGVAPDANLMIGKVSFGKYGAIDLNAVAKGLAWAAEGGAVVANVSANFNVDSTYKKSLVAIDDGIYRSTDTRSWQAGTTYAETGYSHFLTRSYIQNYADAMEGNELVLVASAGNQGMDVSTFPAHMAVLENEDGSLLLGGRVIVAGNYDPKSRNSYAYSSNKAGTVCFDYNETSNTCDNNRRVSDYYLMAPGQYVMSTVDGNDYMTLSGTSMAAPHISGAVAVVHQMWEHMTGENLVKLLLNTGNKDIPNYEESVHGQGLLDLDEATKPQGAVGIPTSGRADGSTSNLNNVSTVSLAGASISALDELMVIDEYDRDFYIDGNDLIVGADTRMVHATKAAQQNLETDDYAGYAMGVPMTFNNLSVNFSEDAENLAFAYGINDFTVGVVKEDESFLGNYAQSDLLKVDGATTLYLGYDFEQQISKGISLFGGATIGVSELNIDNSAMMKSASSALSNSAKLGARFESGKSQFGFVAALPVAITDAEATFETASDITVSGDIVTSNVTSSLANNNREYSFGVFYDTALTKHVSFGAYAEARHNYTSVAGNIRNEIGLTLKGGF